MGGSHRMCLKRHALSRYLWIATVLSSTLAAGSLKNILLGGNIVYNHHMALSQTDNGFPMQAGFPVFRSDALALEARLILQTKTTQHRFSVDLQPRGPLSSSNGRGLDLLLTDRSDHFRLRAGYGLRKRLFRIQRLSLAHGIHLALLYADRQLEYNSGQIHSKQDLNIGLGPVISLRYPLNMRLILHLQFKSLFYLPQLSCGQLYYVDASGATFYNTEFRPFTYADELTVTLQFPLYAGRALVLGYRQTDFLGFARSVPPYFSMSGAVSYRSESNRAFFIGMIFGLRKDRNE